MCLEMLLINFGFGVPLLLIAHYSHLTVHWPKTLYDKRSAQVSEVGGERGSCSLDDSCCIYAYDQSHTDMPDTKSTDQDSETKSIFRCTTYICIYICNSILDNFCIQVDKVD